MAVAYLDASDSVADASLTYAISAGANRILSGFICWEASSGGDLLDAVDIGDQVATALTAEVSPDEDPVSNWVGIKPFILFEAEIAAKTGNDIVPDFNTAPDNYFILARSFQGASQSIGEYTSATDSTNEDGDSLPVTVAGVARGGIIAAVCSGGAGSYTWANVTEREDLNAGSADASLADLLTASAGSVVCDMTRNTTTSNRMASYGVGIPPVGRSRSRSRSGEPGRGYDGAMSRAMTKLGNLWVPDRRLVVPVPAMTRRAA